MVQSKTQSLEIEQGMDPNNAWEAVLGQLRMDMAKATFDTWVKDTELVAFEDGTFIIGVANAYARDWLDSRLTSTISGLLAGMMDRSVEVRFVVWQPRTSEEGHLVLDEDEENASVIDPDMQVTIERSLLETFTKPDTALYFPGYWLRWVPYIGTSPFVTVLAFRQALYMTENCFEEGRSFAIAASKVGSIIGADKQRIRKHRDEGKLSWFLTYKSNNAVKKVGGNRYVREAHSYSFKNAPITPGDIAEIIEFLLEKGLDKDPVNALSLAVDVQPKDIISFPAKRPTKTQRKTQPSSAAADLAANILSYCPAGMEKGTRAQVLELADKLRARMISSDGQVKVPLFFLKHVLPQIKPSPAVLIMYLRKKAYRNSATGEIRERVTLRKNELALALGIAPNSIYRYLPIEINETDLRRNEALVEKRKPIAKYIKDIERKPNGCMALTVSTSDNIPQKMTEEYHAAYELTSILIENFSDEEAEEILDSIHNYCQTLSSVQEKDSQNDTLDDSQFDTLGDSQNDTFDDSQYNTLDDSQIDPIGDSQKDTNTKLERFTKQYNFNYLMFKYIDTELLKNIILNLKTNFNTITTTHSTQEKQQILWENDVGREWLFSNLFKSCHIDSKKQKNLSNNNAKAEAFVSHLIYAFSPEGVGLNQPLRFAIAQVLREGDGDLGYGPIHDRLARLGPEGLQNLIRNTTFYSRFRISKDEKGSQDWERIMKEHRTATQIHELGELLGLLKIVY